MRVYIIFDFPNIDSNTTDGYGIIDNLNNDLSELKYKFDIDKIIEDEDAN